MAAPPKKGTVKKKTVVKKNTKKSVKSKVSSTKKKSASSRSSQKMAGPASPTLDGIQLPGIQVTGSAHAEPAKNTGNLSAAGNDTVNQPLKSDTPKGEVGTDHDSNNDRQEIEKRLKLIAKSDSDEGHEKICLFASRCALRSFPLTIAGIFREFSKTNQTTGVIQFANIWRAVMLAWGYQHQDANASAITGITRVTGDSARAARAASFAADALLAPDMAEIIELAAKAAGASFAAFARAATYAETGSDQVFDVASAAADYDLDLLENSNFKASDFRRIPLWGNQEIPPVITKTDWKSILDQWVSEIMEAGESNNVADVLRKIILDYSAILMEEEASKDNTRDIAEEKTQHDKPSSVDYLGRDRLVNALVPRLSVKDDSDHLTIGLLGDWGIGKTSVIEQLRNKLKEIDHCDYIFGDFNAWKYEHTKSIQAGIAHEVITALTTPLPQWPRDIRRFYKIAVLWKYTTRLHGKRIVVILFMLLLMLVLAGVSVKGNFFDPNNLNFIGQGFIGAGALSFVYFIWQQFNKITAEPLAKELKTYLKLPSFKEHLGKLPEMEKNIQALCDICLGPHDKVNRRMVFFIDDLDRCGVDGIVKTFEAVRLVLGLPWVTVIIAMDQRIALPALACHYERLSKYHQLDPMSIARDYLAKVIHFPIRLQAPDDLSVASYLAHIWKDPEFMNKISDELSVNSAVEVTLGSGIQKEQKNPSHTNSSDGETGESLKGILLDINSVDIQSLLKADDSPPTKVEETQGFGVEQKISFYRWLLSFNLRNPRQIKRLYNSYNLLWSIYDADWKDDEKAWFPNMLGLLVLEMINQHVPYNEKEDTRRKYRQAFFNPDGDGKVHPIKGVDASFINTAHKLILDYQNDRKIDLLVRLEPFVLPAISPQDVNTVVDKTI